MKKKKHNKLIRLFLTISVLVFPFVIDSSVKGIAGDTSGQVSVTSSGCEGKDSCWINLTTSDYDSQLFGIRVTIVNGDGTMVSAKSIDYIGGSQTIADYVNTNTTYYRCNNSIRNKLGYLNGASCNWQLHDGNSIAKYSSWLPRIFNESTAAEDLKTKIMGMNTDTLKETFFNDLGYDINQNRANVKNHYLIIEPLTIISLGGPNSTKYYGTFYELGPKAIQYNYVWTLGTIYLPQSIYSVGNEDIGGSGGLKNQTYFNGKIKIAKNEHLYSYTKGRMALYEKYVTDQSYGYGLGIYWMNSLDLPQTCDYNNSKHFATENGGPNEENCCTYVKNNLSNYGITEAQFYTKYPQCNELLKSCKFDLTINNPTCGVDTTGDISDISNWECIYASAYSNDTSIKNYFLKYGKPTDSCSVYCRNEITYMYPNKGTIVLAGNYFTIGNSANDRYSYLDTNTNTIKIKAATLGPVQIEVTKDCAILGDSNNQTCKDKMQEELYNINAPTVEFAYESDYYNNPKQTLAYESSATPPNTKDGIVSRTVTYNYYLPESTYKYVAKNTGISYKNTSSIGKYPYITIENHSPVHFSHKDKTNNFQLTIKKFNLPNFDNLILNGQTMSTKFDTSIETYVKTLISSDRARPTYLNGLYYLDKTFVSLLNKNGFTAQDLLNSACANTENYNCYSNENGIYCYDKNTTSNSEQTYAYFNSCINSEVQKIKHEKETYKNDMLYQCTFEVESELFNPSNGDNGINVIYRQISLDDPFPSINGDGRETGSNWCDIDDCSNDNQIIQNVITNNRGVKTEELYRDLDPLYTIVLTPSRIKEIRKYNNESPYDDFNFECDSNGDYCKSNFIREPLKHNKYNFSDYFYGCGIDGKQIDENGRRLECAENDEW